MARMEKRITSTASITAIALVAMLILLPVLYVASVGPVLYCDRTMNEGNSPRWIAVVYAPLVYLAESNEAADNALNWYLELWGVWD